MDYWIKLDDLKEGFFLNQGSDNKRKKKITACRTFTSKVEGRSGRERGRLVGVGDCVG